jgi:lipoprotein-releasing system permease protein
MFMPHVLVVLIASLNIISGLVMLVKNKGRDIGILRTMGLTQGAVMRVFFLCGALDRADRHGAGGGPRRASSPSTSRQILAFVERRFGGGVWNPEIRGLYRDAREAGAWATCVSAVALALGAVVPHHAPACPQRRAAEPGRGAAL